MSVRYLTVEDVIGIHDTVETKTSHVRDIGALESAIGRPQQSIFGEDAYPNVYHKAAALMHSLVKNHSFENGNKRTALVATIMFLLSNGRIPYLGNGYCDNIVRLMDDIATGEYDDIDSLSGVLRASTMHLGYVFNPSENTAEDNMKWIMERYGRTIEKLATR